MRSTSELSEKERAAILSGNATRLFPRLAQLAERRRPA
jgi:hypothetical protein